MRGLETESSQIFQAFPQIRVSLNILLSQEPTLDLNSGHERT